LATPDQKCRLAAALALATFTDTVTAWVNDDDRGDLACAIDRGYTLMAELCADWNTPADGRR
jgi:hypothetical protein